MKNELPSKNEIQNESKQGSDTVKMSLSCNNITNNERITNTISDNKSSSPTSSPKSSPRPSPRPQSKQDHSKSDALLTTNYISKDQQLSKHEGSPSSQESSTSRLSNTSNPETSPQSDLKSDLNTSTRDRKDGRSKKKSSWFNSLYPTYKSRTEDFKKLFNEVPVDERLVVDYSCALQKEILVQGRLYVTQNYLCFYANIFGWETNLTLKWKDVAAITKEKTALVIPNAVLICTKTEKFFFTSLVQRDKTYLMLFRLWQNALMDQPMSATEMWQWVHQCYGSELGLTSEDEDYISPSNPDEDKLSSRLSVDSFSEVEVGPAAFNIMDQLSTDEKIDDSSYSAQQLSPTRTGLQLPAEISDSESDKPITMKSEVENIECSSSHEGRVLLNEVYPIHIDQLFTLLFTSSKFYLDFHASRKTSDLTQTPWTHNPLDNSKSRVVNLTMSLGQTMGPKTCQVTERHTMLPCSKSGSLYAVDVETVNAGVPYADSFYVTVHYCLKKVTDSNSLIHVTGQLKFKKNVWGLVKGMIERNVWSGLEDFFAKLKEALQAEGEENIPEQRRKSRRKRRLHTLPKYSLEDVRLKPENSDTNNNDKLVTELSELKNARAEERPSTLIVEGSTFSSTFNTRSYTGSDSTMKQISDIIDEREQNKIDELFARAVYASGMPLLMTDNRYWKELFKALRPAYRLPTCNQISNPLLEAEYNRVELEVDKKIAASNFLSIQCDRWSYVRNETIINYVINTPEPQLYKTEYTDAEKYTAEYLAEQIMNVIEEVGPQKVIGLVWDNSAEIEKANRLVSDMYNHIITYSCVADTLGLLVGDVMKSTCMNGIESDSKSIIREICNSEVNLATFNKIQKEQSGQIFTLKIPVSARWKSILNCIESLHKCKNALKSVAVSEITQNTEFDNNARKNILGDDVYWAQIEKCINLLSPIDKWITILKEDSLGISKVIIAIKELKDVFQKVLVLPEEKDLLDAFNKRHKMAVKNVHYATDLLNPKYRGQNLDAEEHVNAIQCISSLIDNNPMFTERKDQLMSELTDYITGTGLWSKEFIWQCAENTNAINWWKGMCSKTALKEVATALLGLPACSASTKRYVGSYSTIYTAERNGLTVERAGKLFYIEYNLKLKETFEKTKQENKTVFSSEEEEPEPSTSIPRKKLSQSGGIFTTDVCTALVFGVLLLLLVINVMLYYKLWSLEEGSSNFFDLNTLKHSPKSHDDWIKLLQQQESIHSVEAQKWQRVLKTAVHLLRQAEESLNELQRSIHPNYMSQVISAMQDNQETKSEL